jgi:hypothetical protein
MLNIIADYRLGLHDSTYDPPNTGTTNITTPDATVDRSDEFLNAIGKWAFWLLISALVICCLFWLNRRLGITRKTAERLDRWRGRRMIALLRKSIPPKRAFPVIPLRK